MTAENRRVNVVIREDQYEELQSRGLNVSGLIRDLLGDYLSSNTIALQVSDETRSLYETIVSNTGASDEDLEVHLRDALAKVLEDRIEQMKALHARLGKQQSRPGPRGSR